jgi:transitional endoplasmic reticulum ATPase
VLQDAFIGKPAIVLHLSDEGRTLHLRLEDGRTARVSGTEPFSLSSGDVVLLNEDRLEGAPKELWREEYAVGIIRKKLSGQLLVESNLALRIIPAGDIDVDVGNTVAFSDTSGVHSIVSTEPLRARDFGAEEETADKYRVTTAHGPTFEDFGGYETVVSRAKELIETQLDHKTELEAIGARPIKGILFTGPPGTGKTYLARIVACQAKADFFLISGPSIVSKWVGDSEESLRRIFEAASRCERAVIFIDEIDSVAGQRGNDSHEASERLVAQLLTLMDGYDQDEGGNVVVIAATNRIDDLDTALRRPGRFDWEIEFTLPSLSDRLGILKASARGIATDGEMPLREIAERSDSWSAAKLSSLWTEAALLAARDSRSAITEEDMAEAYEAVRSRPNQLEHGGANGDEELVR